MMGKAIILSAPSGAGKTTIVKYLLTQGLPLAFSISACTRAKREGEVDGKDYYFLTPDKFRSKVDEGAFVEWEEVYKDQMYGTLKSEVERIWGEGKHVIFDVDVLGGLNLKEYFGDRALAIFVRPPSLEVLRERLIKRGTESEETIQKRMDRAEKEMAFAPKFDFVLVNDDLEAAKHTSLDAVNNFLG